MILFILDSLHAKSLLGDYIKVIAEVSPKILQLPKSSLKHSGHHQRDHAHANEEDSTTDDESEEEDEHYQYQNKRNIQPMDTSEASCTVPLTESEKESLLECIHLLNEGVRVHTILDYIEEYLADEDVLYGLCEICHNLMIYNKMAMFEYK